MATDPMRGFPEGILLHDLRTGYSARVGPGLNDCTTVTGQRAGELDPRKGVDVASCRHGCVLTLVPDMSDPETRRLLGPKGVGHGD